jgi:hypothetical protein
LATASPESWPKKTIAGCADEHHRRSAGFDCVCFDDDSRAQLVLAPENHFVVVLERQRREHHREERADFRVKRRLLNKRHGRLQNAGDLSESDRAGCIAAAFDDDVSDAAICGRAGSVSQHDEKSHAHEQAVQASWLAGHGQQPDGIEEELSAKRLNRARDAAGEVFRSKDDKSHFFHL